MSCLHAEAEGAILHATERFEECARNLTFHVGGARASLWLCLCRILGSLYCKMWAGLNGFDPRNNLVLGSVRRHGLRESSYYYSSYMQVIVLVIIASP